MTRYQQILKLRETAVTISQLEILNSGVSGGDAYHKRAQELTNLKLQFDQQLAQIKPYHN